MKKRHFCLIVVCLGVPLVAAVGVTLPKGAAEPEDYIPINRTAKIRPDYTGVVLPPNIAPLNFLISESGERYLVKIHSMAGEVINISSRNGKIKIPQRQSKAR